MRVGPYIIARRYTYVLLADTLAGLRDQLPPGLTRTDRQPADSPEIMEVWFPSNGDRARVSLAPP